jgi:class 3 adenylate cyclase
VDDRAASPEDLRRENRLLARKLARMDSNVRQMEEMQDSTSKLLSSLMRELDQERARSQSLLLNILPQAIIDRLGGGETIADRYDSVTVLFSDLVGFTSISSELEPQLLVSELNKLFSEFDALCERTEVEKIKTIGDAYLAVGGLPGTRTDHATAVAELALGMVEAVERLNRSSDRNWRIRIGVHSGPAVAGVIGTRKFVYDVWGDTVNVASRLESSAEPNRIHVSEPVAEALRGSFDLEPRGTVDLKGKGKTESYLLRGPAG